jgi:hypothetical protein
MSSHSDQSRQLYIPDFKVWERIYAKRLPVGSAAAAAAATEKQTKAVAVRGPSEVKLQFVSPVVETVRQAESELKANSLPPTKETTTTTTNIKKTLQFPERNRAKDTSDQQKRKRKHQSSGNPAAAKKFSYSALNDIFSKSR